MFEVRSYGVHISCYVLPATGVLSFMVEAHLGQCVKTLELLNYSRHTRLSLGLSFTHRIRKANLNRNRPATPGLGPAKSSTAYSTLKIRW